MSQRSVGVEQTIARWQAQGALRPVRNRHLFVVDTGPRDDAAPLVLVHGFPTSAWDFAPLLDAMAGRRVVAFDLLGFGLSDKPWPHEYSLLEQAELTIGLIASLGIKRCHLVGHDMGDTVVQELVAKSLDGGHLLPFEIASVALLNGGVLAGRHRPILSQRLLRFPAARAVVPRLPEPLARRLFERSLRRIAGPDRPPPVEELETQFALLAREGGIRLLPHLIGYLRERELHAKRWRRALLTHELPMRFVWGDCDPINPWSTVEEIVAARPATEAIRLHHVGHYPQLEAPGQVAVHLMEFVARH